MVSRARRDGLGYGIGAYLCWGLFPAYFSLLAPAGPVEVLAHRIVWSAVFLLAVLAVARRLGDLARLSARTWLQLLAASVLISVNWGTYIFAVLNDHVVDAALGYFINPLVSVALAVLVLGERIGGLQRIALIIATIAVIVLTVEVGRPPYIAVILATSFGIYGLVKKVVDADPRVSVAVETLLALPFAGGFLIVLHLWGEGHFGDHGVGHTLLLLGAGPATAIPLLLFAAAAQRLPLVVLGLLFYLNPALQMAWGVVINQESMPLGRWIGFALIWVALAVLVLDALRRGATPAAEPPVAARDAGDP